MKSGRVSILDCHLKYGPGYSRRKKYFDNGQEFFCFSRPIKLFTDSLQYFGCGLGDYESFIDKVYSPCGDCITYLLTFIYKGYVCCIGVTVKSHKSIVRIYFPEIHTDDNYKLLHTFCQALTYSKDEELLASEIVEELNLYLN